MAHIDEARPDSKESAFGAPNFVVTERTARPLPVPESDCLASWISASREADRHDQETNERDDLDERKPESAGACQQPVRTFRRNTHSTSPKTLMPRKLTSRMATLGFPLGSGMSHYLAIDSHENADPRRDRDRLSSGPVPNDDTGDCDIVWSDNQVFEEVLIAEMSSLPIF